MTRLARNTLVFSLFTALSRVIGLLREVVSSAYFGTAGPISAFTIAFQIPNLVRSLFADAALSSAFVPVFTELLEQGKRREAARLAGSLAGLIVVGLGAITVLGILVTGVVVPAVTPDTFSARLDDLTVGMTQLMFPIVVLLALNGLLIGILNTQDRFGIQAFSPVVWNLVIIGFLVFGRGLFDGDEEVYAYAVGVLVGTAVQLALALPALREFELRPRLDLRDERVRQVLRLMLPVTIGLGLINFNLLINSFVGLLVSDEAPSAIDRAFRVYMLPQGVFSVAIATVLFPALSRLATRGDLDALRAQVASGTRLILLLLLPAAAATLVLAEPITRLLYERGAFDAGSTDQVAEALVWFSVSLPFSGVNLLLTRTFFSLQLPWRPTALAVLSLLVNVVVSLALYRPLGIAGVVIGTVAGTLTTTLTQFVALRRELAGRLEAGAILVAAAKVAAASALLGVVALLVHRGVQGVVGDALVGQALAVGLALAAGTAAFAVAVALARVPEAVTLQRLVIDRVQARRPGDR